MPEQYLDYIKSKEGFSEKAFKDNSQYSIGYGTRTDDPYEIAGLSTIDEVEAHARLVSHTDKDRAAILKQGEARGLEFGGNELDALTSFTYNLGQGSLNTLLEGRDKGQIAEAISLYNKSDGKVLDGLVTRREEEVDQFNTPDFENQIEEGDDEEFVMPEPSADADLSYLDYSEPNIPMSVLRAEPTEVEGETPSTWELVKASVDRHHLINSAERETAINREVIKDDYEVPLEALNEYNDKGYSRTEIDFLSEAASPTNFANRLFRIDSDRQTKTLIEQGGMKGTGVEMLTSILDPILIPTFFAGASGAAIKWNSFKAIGMSMLSGSSQNLAVEYLLKQGDTQRTDEDLMLAAAFGAGFSGLITTAGLGIKAARGRVNTANEINAAGKQEVKAAMHDVVYKKVDSALSEEIPNPVERKVFLTEKEIVAKLQEERGTKVNTISSKKIKDSKVEFRAYKKKQVAKIEAMKASKIKPSARNKQVANMEKALSDKELELTAVIDKNNVNLQANSELSALQNGKIPDSMQARYSELKAEAGEFDGPRQIEPESTLPQPKPRAVDEEGVEIPEDKSVGAMQVQTQFADIKTNDDLLAETEVQGIADAVNTAYTLGQETPRVSRLATEANVGGIGFTSTSSTIDAAPDAATRGIGIQTLKNGTRTIEGHQSAEELAEVLFFRNVPDYLSHERAFHEYAASKGIGIFQWKKRSELKDEFEKLLVLEQASGRITSNAADKLDEPIIKAAKARARIYERSLRNYKEYDVVGFKDVEHTNEYHSIVFSAENLSKLTAHADVIVDVIAKAYQNGKIKLTRANALKLAEAQIERSYTWNGGSTTSFKPMSNAEWKNLDIELEASGMDATTRAELKSSLFNKEDAQQMSPRAMFSLKPDLTAETTGVRLVDIIDTSMNRVMKYASDAAGSAGLASHGYKSRNQFLRAVEEARQQAISALKFSSNNSVGKAKEEAQKALARVTDAKDQQLLVDAVKLMFREPLDDIAGDGITDITKALRKQVSITRLRSTGLMAIPEYAIAMARNGAMATIKSLPNSRFFDLRSRSVEQDEFMTDWARSFSATGHQEYLFGSKFYNNSDFDDATKGKISNMINKMQGTAMNVTMTVNTFRSFQHGGEEMVARSIVSNLKDMVLKGKITPEVRSSLIKVGGLSEDQVGEMIAHFQARPDLDVFTSVRQMEPKLGDALSIAARNTIGSSFMRMGIGESVPYANREMGKIMTSLLNFTIGSWEKMVVRGIKSDGAAPLAAMFAGQSALALMSQYAYVHSRAAGMEGTERDKYIEKNLSDEGLFWGTFNRVGFLAAPALPLQMMSAARLLPEAIEASPTKAGVSKAGIPMLGMAEDILKATGSTADLVTGTWSDEYMSNKTREGNWKNIKRVLPWIDSPVYNFTLGQVD